jgi:transcriptional regulator with XRE-family HTH domain
MFVHMKVTDSKHGPRLKLREARMREKMTQEALARKAGLSSSMIALLESGRKRGSVDTWDRLELVLGVDQRVLRLPDEASLLEAPDQRLD